jgi:hypothetical protein
MHVRSIVAHDPILAEIITTGFAIASPKGKREFTFIIFLDDDPNLSVEKIHVMWISNDSTHPIQCQSPAISHPHLHCCEQIRHSLRRVHLGGKISTMHYLRSVV